MENFLKKIFIGISSIWLLALQPLTGIDLVFETDEGKKISLDIDSKDSIDALLKQVNNYLDEKQTLKVKIKTMSSSFDSDSELSNRFVDSRNYYAPVPETAIKDMRFIILTLGNEPLLKLKQYKKALSEAGDRLDEVHPLNFWKEIFTDEKMTSGIHNIKKRGNVWKSFMKGMGKSLQEAADGDNLKPEYIKDFASKLNIDANLIMSVIEKADWNNFAKLLLLYVPRQGNLDRYDQ